VTAADYRWAAGEPAGSGWGSSPGSAAGGRRRANRLRRACAVLTRPRRVAGEAIRVSLTAITVSRPSATAATNATARPSPVKKPICSRERAVVPPTGVPALTWWPRQITPIRPPTANHAPLRAASQAPNSAAGRDALASRIRPPATAAAAGVISSQSRPEV
jgi:hypothetical protein